MYTFYISLIKAAYRILQTKLSNKPNGFGYTLYT